MRRGVSLVVLSALALGGLAAGLLAPGGSATVRTPAKTHAGRSAKVTRVAVVAKEFSFKLSKRKVPKGTVIFTIVNKGKISHDFKIAGKKTKTLNPGKKATLRVVFKKKGRFAYVCTLPGHARLGMKGVLGVNVTPPPPAPPPTTGTTTTTPPPPPTGTVGTGNTTVNVDMSEYRFDLSQASVPSGQVTFVITNKDEEVHNFDLVGVKAGALLAPGQKETWTVSLPPKGYTGVCDVPFHIDRGMTPSFTVTP
jgi:uncharacterized cupredoxin-like copper-binding protein